MSSFSLHDDKLCFICDFNYEQFTNEGDELDFLVVSDIIQVDTIMKIKDGLLSVKNGEVTDSFFGLKAKELKYTEGKPHIRFNYERRLRHS